jgi:hypothetical protein
MTSVAARLGPASPDFGQVRLRTAEQMAETLEYQDLRWAGAEEAWQAAGENPPVVRTAEAQHRAA